MHPLGQAQWVTQGSGAPGLRLQAPPWVTWSLPSEAEMVWWGEMITGIVSSSLSEKDRRKGDSMRKRFIAS